MENTGLQSSQVYAHINRKCHDYDLKWSERDWIQDMRISHHNLLHHQEQDIPIHHNILIRETTLQSTTRSFR